MNCMAHAFSSALGIPFAQYIAMVGHDGSRKCFQDQTFSQGFHIQECIDVCFTLGFSCTEIQAFFGSAPYFDSLEQVAIYTPQICEARFLRYLEKTTSGVIAGMVIRASGQKVGHAVMWDGKLIHDSRGDTYEFQDSEVYNFHPQTLWMLTKMELKNV
jgi:hypothetical protein